MDEPQAIPSTPPAATAVAVDGGLADNVAGAIAYITFIPAVLFLILAPYSTRPFVRFHALQCLGLYVCLFAIGIIGIIPVLGWIVAFVGGITLFVFWLLCIIKASQGQRYKVPVIGNYVEQMAAAK